MGSSILGVLSVDEGEIVLAVARGVQKRKFDTFPTIMERFVEAIFLDLLIEQIEKSIFRTDRLAIKKEGEPVLR